MEKKNEEKKYSNNGAEFEEKKFNALAHNQIKRTIKEADNNDRK